MKKRHRNDGLQKLCSCRRDRWGECPHSWHFNLKWAGVHHRFSLDRHLGRRLRGKTEAVAEAEKLRAEIRDGKLRPHNAAVPPTITPGILSVDEFSTIYLARALNNRRDDVYRLRRLCNFTFESGRRFGEKALTAVTEDDLEVFMAHLRAKGLAASTRNHYVQDIRATLRWAVRKGYLTKNPISEDSALKREKGNRRSRRLLGDEEHRLITVAPPWMQWLIVAALETGCRLGELLGLQWRDINEEHGELTVRAENAKDGEVRRIPVSGRLRAILAMVPKHDPAGDLFGPRRFIFGDEIGERRRVTSKAWQTTVLKANGHTPQWSKGTKALLPVSQEAYRRVDLHFHDLRHEAASRWLEAGMELHHIQALLGHASLSTTAIYLNATGLGLRDAMRRVDARRAEQDQPQPMPSVERQDVPLVHLYLSGCFSWALDVVVSRVSLIVGGPVLRGYGATEWADAPCRARAGSERRPWAVAGDCGERRTRRGRREVARG